MRVRQFNLYLLYGLIRVENVKVIIILFLCAFYFVHTDNGNRSVFRYR